MLSLFFSFTILPSALAQPSSTSTTAEDAPVTVKDNGATFTLSNGYLTATISKTSGDLVSLKYHGLETMGFVSGHHAGYWEQNPSGAAREAATISMDPATNHGERGEVSIKGWSDGKSLLGEGNLPSDPGAKNEIAALQTGGRHIGPPPGSARRPNAGTFVGRRFGGRSRGMIVDMEIRYSLGRGDHGIYTYAIFTHEPSYGATNIGESRFGAKLNSQVFDWLSVDSQRNALMPTSYDWDMGTQLNMKEARRLTTGVYKGRVEHKYDYCADQFKTPAYGWSSTKHHIGIYFINPSMEYLSSGPNHFELTGHIDDGDGGDPTLLDYWRGTHYGGSMLPIAAGENWNKVVGPIFIYLDSGKTPDAMFRDAIAQAHREAAKWPYTWVRGVDYPQAAQRSTVEGQLVLKDPQAPGAALPNLLVGLAYPDATSDVPELQRGYGRQKMTWQNDAKHYEFWVRGSADGHFSIPKVRPGTYELHAIADGVLGEYAKANITVGAGKTIDLGKLDWTPVRYGKQLWQIGIPNRSASEFLMGKDHWHWGLYLQYSKLFPHDVDYTVGKSDFHTDWFIYQVPHVINDDGTGRGKGRATTWTIHFDISRTTSIPAHGQAVLRLGLDGVSARFIDVGVNNKPAGTVDGLIYNATINRDGVEGSWVEKDLRFDAALLHPGQNTMTLTVPAGGLTSGISYDVLRLELAGGQ
ncbi:MAG: polysaccharide lyase family protein [Acidobacteriaceae bacterium]